MKDDPIEYAKEKLLNIIDEVDDNKIIHLKSIIKEYFSDNLQYDESHSGALRRNQIRKELLEFATK